MADIRQAQDFSPFGVTLQGRNFTASGADGFRYGFQGQEMDDEIKGKGNSVNYKYRMHDPRIGRFFAIDPLAFKYPHNSPFAFSENRVLDGVELEGLEFAGFDPMKYMNDIFVGEVKHAETVVQENTHLALDILGCVPIIGEGFDMVNGVIYSFEGEYANAAISFASIVPFVGDAGKISKYVVKYGSKVDNIVSGGKVFSTAAKAKEFTRQSVLFGYKQAEQLWDRGYLRGNLQKAGKALKGEWQAHHVIPIGFIKDNKIVQEAIDQGFDMNSIDNGLAISKTRHNGSHPAYDRMVNSLLNKNMEKYGNAKDAMEATVTEVKRRINHAEHKNRKINDIGKYYGFDKKSK
jgi:RHS repeat-associated protein